MWWRRSEERCGGGGSGSGGGGGGPMYAMRQRMSNGVVLVPLHEHQEFQKWCLTGECVHLYVCN